MSGIGRFLAGVLLVGAVGGAAAFARQSGSDPSAPAVSLAAPPPQHIGAPGTVLFARTPPPTRVAVIVGGRRSLPPPKPTRAVRPVIAAPRPARTTTPAPPPAPTPVTERTVILAPVPLPPRTLAAVPAAVGQPATAVKGHGLAHGHDRGRVEPGQGHAWGHSKDRGTPTAD